MSEAYNSWWPDLPLTHPFLFLEGHPAWFGASTAQSVHHFVLEQRRITKVLINGVGGHFGNVLRCLCLDVKSDEGVRHQVVDRLKPLLPHKVLSIIKQSVVESLMPKPGLTWRDMKKRKGDVLRLNRFTVLIELTPPCFCKGFGTLRLRCVTLAVFGSPWWGKHPLLLPAARLHNLVKSCHEI